METIISYYGLLLRILLVLYPYYTIGCDELVFETNSPQPRSRSSLDASLNNLVLIDQIYRENVKQTQLILECNQKLASLETELTKVGSGFTSSSSAAFFPRPTDFNESSSVAALLKNLKTQLIDYFKYHIINNSNYNNYSFNIYTVIIDLLLLLLQFFPILSLSLFLFFGNSQL